MNLSFLRPSSLIKSIEDGFIGTGQIISTTVIAGAKWLHNAHDTRRIEQFRRDARRAGLSLRKARS